VALARRLVNAFVGQSSGGLSQLSGRQLSGRQLTGCLWALTQLGVQLSPKWLTLAGAQLAPVAAGMQAAELLATATALDAQYGGGAAAAAAGPPQHLLRALAAGWEGAVVELGPARAAAALLLLARHGCCPSARGLAAFQVGRAELRCAEPSWPELRAARAAVDVWQHSAVVPWRRAVNAMQQAQCKLARIPCPPQESTIASLPAQAPSVLVTALWCHAALLAQPPAAWLAAAAAAAGAGAGDLPAGEACRLAWALARLGLRCDGSNSGSGGGTPVEAQPLQQVVAAEVLEAVAAAAAAGLEAAPVPDAAATAWAVSELRQRPVALPLLRCLAARLAGGRAAQLPATQLLELLELMSEAGFSPEAALQVHAPVQQAPGKHGISTRS
jgi:hypothetical protein